jgi:hypothetical protein
MRALLGLFGLPDLDNGPVLLSPTRLIDSRYPSEEL